MPRSEQVARHGRLEHLRRAGDLRRRAPPSSWHADVVGVAVAAVGVVGHEDVGVLLAQDVGERLRAPPRAARAHSGTAPPGAAAVVAVQTGVGVPEAHEPVARRARGGLLELGRRAARRGRRRACRSTRAPRRRRSRRPARRAGPRPRRAPSCPRSAAPRRRGARARTPASWLPAILPPARPCQTPPAVCRRRREPPAPGPRGCVPPGTRGHADGSGQSASPPDARPGARRDPRALASPRGTRPTRTSWQRRGGRRRGARVGSRACGSSTSATATRRGSVASRPRSARSPCARPPRATTSTSSPRPRATTYAAAPRCSTASSCTAPPSRMPADLPVHPRVTRVIARRSSAPGGGAAGRRRRARARRRRLAVRLPGRARRAPARPAHRRHDPRRLGRGVPARRAARRPASRTWTRWGVVLTAVSDAAADPIRAIVGPDVPVEPRAQRHRRRRAGACTHVAGDPDETRLVAVMRLAPRKRAMALVQMAHERAPLAPEPDAACASRSSATARCTAQVQTLRRRARSDARPVRRRPRRAASRPTSVQGDPRGVRRVRRAGEARVVRHRGARGAHGGPAGAGVRRHRDPLVRAPRGRGPARRRRPRDGRQHRAHRQPTTPCASASPSTTARTEPAQSWPHVLAHRRGAYAEARSR